MSVKQPLAVSMWLTCVAIIVLRNGVNGQFTALGSGGVRGSDYGSAVGSPSNGAGVGVGNGEILMPKPIPISAQEPTCEELRAMWRFSKRQSRASEMTNELPTYRDPFAFNIWEPYISTSRSMGGMRIVPRYRDATRPVYGRVVHHEPLVNFMDRGRAMEDFSRMYGMYGQSKQVQHSIDPRRRGTVRFFGGNVQNILTPHHGSFQKVKELIWTDRARELAAERKVEETAARAAVLKDLSNGQRLNLHRQLQHQHQQNRMQHQQNSPLMDENRSPLESDFAVGSVSMLPGNAAKVPPYISGSSSSMFSSNPSNVGSSLRSGGVLLPPSSTSGSQSRAYGYGQPTSIFRERNRALFHQSSSLPLSSSLQSANNGFQRDQRTDTDYNNDNVDFLLELIKPITSSESRLRNFERPLETIDDENDETNSDQSYESFLNLLY